VCKYQNFYIFSLQIDYFFKFTIDKEQMFVYNEIAGWQKMGDLAEYL